ncbi:MAG: prephenate dehydrogenase/arogenate dehydrogenase family protein [Anaerolineales bacterium]
MSSEILFIGLGQIGTSIALNFARSEAEIVLIGHDPVGENARRAKELGAVQRLVSNPGRASKSADAIVLDVPPAALHGYLEMLGKRLKPGGLLIDTTPTRSTAIRWAEESLPADRHYLGASPIIGPHVFSASPEERKQPRVDLFQNGLLAIAVPKDGSEETVSAGLDLARLLGAAPIFIDAHENDGIAATVEWLPRLLGAALLQEAAKAGNWRDIQSMAGTTFAAITSLCSEEPVYDSRDYDALNLEILRAKLAHFIGELHNLHGVLADESGKSLGEYVAAANAARDQWLSTRQRGAPDDKKAPPGRMPKRRSTIEKLFGFNLPGGRS